MRVLKIIGLLVPLFMIQIAGNSENATLRRQLLALVRSLVLVLP